MYLPAARLEGGYFLGTPLIYMQGISEEWMNEQANEWQIVSYSYFKAYTTSAMISAILNLLLIAIIDELHISICDTGQHSLLGNDNSAIIFLPTPR